MAGHEVYIDDQSGFQSVGFSTSLDAETDIQTAHIDIKDTAAFMAEVSGVRERMALERQNETTLAKVGRVTVDLALGDVGTVVSTAVGVYVGSRLFEGVLPVVGSGVVGFVAQEFLRRPIVGARSLWHSWRNPYSPAAQSNARIRREILSL